MNPFMDMKRYSYCLNAMLFQFFLFVLLSLLSEGIESDTTVYIVYMGAPGNKNEDPVSDHLELISSVTASKKPHSQGLLVRSYMNGFSGFAARLTAQHAAAMAKQPQVVSVFVDPFLQLHTTRSWDFLQEHTELEPYSDMDSDSGSRNNTNTIIGLLDTGVWPESPSFDDMDMGAIPARWKGVCMEGKDFNSSYCNRKLIGARYYKDNSPSVAWTAQDTPRDTLGHGTHTSSTAAGSLVAGANYYGLAAGIAKGGSPTSRLAVYKVCTEEGCKGSAILAAFDDAIGDGVDILSLSLGASPFFKPDFVNDPIAIGAFHATQHGILVVCSAGNGGPDSSSVVNSAPWILTVAATTIDRDFESDLVLGSGGSTTTKTIKGEAINFSNLNKSPVYPLIYGGTAGNCNPGSLDGEKIKGKIVLCQHTDQGYSKKEKMNGVKSLGGFGVALVDNEERYVAFDYDTFPATALSSASAKEVLSHINSTRNPVATILPTVAVTKFKPAPTVAYFSSRGPSTDTKNILKPDVAAPGVNILAAYIPTSGSSVPPGQSPSQFNLLSGTSMACPHVSGIAALIKSKHPTWSPSAIRSAIMTTATETDNSKAQMTTDSGSSATPYDYGTGEVNPTGALQPGLIYETSGEDYFFFLCNYGYNSSSIKIISGKTGNYTCPSNSSIESISDLNYPSIAIVNLDNKSGKTVKRTVTNVGIDMETIYTATVKAPKGLDVKVSPDRLQFTETSKSLSYQVTFASSGSSIKKDAFGSITWSNGKHSVKTTFVVSVS
ncbi:hypothetical protein AMTRI_Chr09g38770 [Amborella trichopoda]